MNTTHQMQMWSREFGSDYTERNDQTVDDLDAYYKANFNVTRNEMNSHFLTDVDRSARILEVGCNIGLQLGVLQKMGFSNLYGIELQERAVKKVYQNFSGIRVMQGSAFELPFQDHYFDLVYTSGVLIHIHPNDLSKVMGEMYRCTGRLIWGFEYFAGQIEEIEYRGHKDLLWRADYATLFQKSFPTLQVCLKEFFKYTASENRDCMYLLKKG